MNIKNLIAKLQELQDEFGPETPVFVNGDDICPVTDAECFDGDDEYPGGIYLYVGGGVA